MQHENLMTGSQTFWGDGIVVSERCVPEVFSMAPDRLELQSAICPLPHGGRPGLGGAFGLQAFQHQRCPALWMPQDRRFVYVLKSSNPRVHHYVGLTHDVPARLADHNAGRCPHTARYRPWQLHVTIGLPDQQRAVDFERYLKSGSGRAFAKRHFG